eukprot:g19854.t1
MAAERLMYETDALIRGDSNDDDEIKREAEKIMNRVEAERDMEVNAIIDRLEHEIVLTPTPAKIDPPADLRAEDMLTADLNEEFDIAVNAENEGAGSSELDDVASSRNPEREDESSEDTSEVEVAKWFQHLQGDEKNVSPEK